MVRARRAGAGNGQPGLFQFKVGRPRPCRRLCWGGETAQRPDGKVPPSPETGRPEPRGPGTRALGGSARLQPGSGRPLSLVPPRAERPRPCLPAPRTRPASPGKAGAQSGGPGIWVLCRWAHVARSPRPGSPADAWRRRASDRRRRGAQRRSRLGSRVGVPGGAQPTARGDAAEGSLTNPARRSEPRRRLKVRVGGGGPAPRLLLSPRPARPRGQT